MAVLRAAAERAGVRGAPESASMFLRRALAEPPPDRAVEADVRSELGLALAAHVQPDAPALLLEAVELAGSPNRRAEIALSGARALGLAGHFDNAIELCRRGLEQPAGIPADLLARLEAELVCDAWLHASTVPEAHERLRRLASSTPPLELWRINAAWEAMCDGRPASEARALLAPALEAGALDGDADSLLGTFATFVLIAGGDLDAARERCDAVIDFARPRGWLIALAHGSFMRAIALVHAGQIRDAEADARLAFDFKLANSPPAALLWALFPLVDALTELDELDDADDALAAVGLLGDPPARCPRRAAAARKPRPPAARPAPPRRRARRPARRRRPLGRARHPRTPASPPGASTTREALVALDDIPAARRLAEEHLELAERVDLPGPRGAGLRALAHTAERDEAVALLEQAVDLLAPSPAQLEHTRALVELGAALRRANRRADARRAAAPRARARRPRRHAPARPPRPGRAARRRRPAASHRALRHRRAHPDRASRRHARRPRVTATARSPSSSTSPAAPSRPTSPTPTRSSTSPPAHELAPRFADDDHDDMTLATRERALSGRN